MEQKNRTEGTQTRGIRFRKPFVPTLAQRVAREIIRVRAGNHLTQAEFAQKIGTKQSVISRAESGRIVPSLRFLDKIAQVFGLQLVMKFEEKQAVVQASPAEPVKHIASGKLISFPSPVDSREEPTWRRSSIAPEVSERSGEVA